MVNLKKIKLRGNSKHRNIDVKSLLDGKKSPEMGLVVGSENFVTSPMIRPIRQIYGPTGRRIPVSVMKKGETSSKTLEDLQKLKEQYKKKCPKGNCFQKSFENGKPTGKKKRNLVENVRNYVRERGKEFKEGVINYNSIT